MTPEQKQGMELAAVHLDNIANDTSHAYIKWALSTSAQHIRQYTAPPVDMILHCPQCHTKHIDAPSADWSHLCHGCGNIWRPADVCTNGVESIKTAGKNDGMPIAKIACDNCGKIIDDNPYKLCDAHLKEFQDWLTEKYATTKKYGSQP